MVNTYRNIIKPLVLFIFTLLHSGALLASELHTVNSLGMEFVSAYGAELHDVKEFARRLDVDVATVRLWEEGAREPLEVELTAIAYITSTTVRYLQRPLQYASLSFEEWQNLESVTTEHGEITMSFEPITGRIIRREFSVPMVYHPETVKIVFE